MLVSQKCSMKTFICFSGTATQADPSSPVDQQYDVQYPTFAPGDGNKPGPTADIPVNSTPIFFFRLLFTQALINIIVMETNRYAASKGVKNWVDTSEEEILCFFGLLVALGIHRLPKMNDIWSSDWILGVPALARFMTKNRFLALWGNLHLVDNEAYLREHPKGSDSYDKLFKLRPALDALLESFKKNYNLHQAVSGDEAMVKGKGRNPVMQYLSMKPIKRGTKIWCLCDSTTGYLYCFQIYAGKEGEAGEVGLGGRVIMDLTCEIVNRNHVLFVDNFFTSIPLAQQLENAGIFLCGTIRQNRKGFPAELKEFTKMERGQFHTKQVDGKLTATVWQDTKLVSFLSNISPPKADTTLARKQRDGSVKNITCPPCVPLYNANMGGVDRCDAAVRIFAVDRKCRRWWIRPFLSLAVDRARVNAYILYQESYAVWPEEVRGKKLTHKEFVSTLAKELMGNFCGRKKPGPKVNPLYKLPLVRDENHESVNVVALGLVKKGRCDYCCKGGGPEERKETRMGCARCEVRLCPSKCHDMYHASLRTPPH